MKCVKTQHSPNQMTNY